MCKKIIINPGYYSRKPATSIFKCYRFLHFEGTDGIFASRLKLPRLNEFYRDPFCIYDFLSRCVRLQNLNFFTPFRLLLSTLIANWMFSYLAVHIYKNYDVRLVDGVKGSFEGRVEVYRVGSWGTICDDEWGLSDANVVCKQLGYASAINAHGKSYFGEGTGRIWLDDLACMGNETNIGQCLHRGWGSHDCTHKQDAGVVCDKGKADAFQHFIIVIREPKQPRRQLRR